MLKTLMSRMLLCCSFVYLWLAYSWATTPTQSRLAGISWIPFPIDEKAIAVLWFAGSVFALLGALCKKLTIPVAVIPAIVPVLIALIFFGAWLDSGEVAQLTTVVSYAGFGISQFIVASSPAAYMPTSWLEMDKHDEC